MFLCCLICISVCVCVYAGIGVYFSETVEQSGKLLLLLSRFGKHTWFAAEYPQHRQTKHPPD